VNDILKKIKLFNPFYAGVAAILWSIWIIGNKVIFDNCQLKSLLQVQFKGSTGFGSDCNTPGVCHQLSSEFELKHDRLSGDYDVKVNLWTRAPT
jgi:hypothetical protein